MISIKFLCFALYSCIAPADPPRRRGKAKALAVKNHKKMNNNQKPRVEFRQGLLKPVGPWAKEFASETARIVRMNAPLASRRWKKVKPEDKTYLHDRILVIFIFVFIIKILEVANFFIGLSCRRVLMWTYIFHMYEEL